MTILSIVVPCFNEEDVLPEANRRLTLLLDRLIEQDKIGPESKIYYVNDGSTDSTWDLIQLFSSNSKYVNGIKLASNVGHQNALLAGLMAAEGDVVISIDADLQDDLCVIDMMLDEHICNGAEIVYGVRNNRDSDSSFKRGTANFFYKFLRWMGTNLVDNHADCRLMNRRAIEALRDFREVNLFLRGIVPLIGLKSSIVAYDRRERIAGSSKYPLGRMLSLAIDGITSFSVVPLRIIAIIGFLVFCASSAITIWILAIALFTDRALPGWASTVLPIYFIGGIQILCIGILGEYTGKIYNEVKQRPRYIIEETVN